MSRDAKCSSAEQVPFMEEWKARRERMRLRSSSSSLVGSRSIDIQVQQDVDLQSQSWSSYSGQDHEKDMGGVKATTSSIKIQSLVTAEVEAHEPVTSKTKEKKGSPQKKHRTQIEKRKLREKRRPTGVVNMFPSEDPDETEEVKENEEHKEQEVVIQNQDLRLSEGTCINRPDVHSLGCVPDNRDNCLKERQSWLEELQKAVRGKRQDNLMLTSQLNDKEGSLLQLQIEMKTLTQKMNKAEDENTRLKEENQMLLKMMGQLSS
ncbi:PRKC apoptosis WT1 regulator protein-like [Mantella aurantiaca]